MNSNQNMFVAIKSDVNRVVIVCVCVCASSLLNASLTSGCCEAEMLGPGNGQY